MYLHIAQHDVYGRMFRERVADLTASPEDVTAAKQMLGDSDPEIIDDE
jgi:hypothetical protein